VRLGITVPRGVPVHRQEVYEAIHGMFRGQGQLVAADPAPTPGEDLLPDLILECRLAAPSNARAQFTSEGGFFFREDPPGQQAPAAGKSFPRAGRGRTWQAISFASHSHRLKPAADPEAGKKSMSEVVPVPPQPVGSRYHSPMARKRKPPPEPTVTFWGATRT